MSDFKGVAYLGWAIETNNKDVDGYIGSLWWFGGRPTQHPEHMAGHRISIFRTRAEARRALPDVKRRFPDAAVRRVRVGVVEK